MDLLLRKLRWRPGEIKGSRVKDGCTIIPLLPSEARGLEFDGVVVVEPADFPANMGREGPLYTSLTRATKELVLVHNKKLPRRLRSRSD